MDGNVTDDPLDIDLNLRNETIPARIIQAYEVMPVLTAIKLVIGCTGVLGNALVVIVIMKYRKLFQQVKSVYIINQSFIDATVSAILISTLFIRKSTVPIALLQNSLFCKLFLSQFHLWGLMLSSTYNLMAISIERYMAIVHPLWHKVSFTKTKANALLVFIWLFGVLFVGSFTIPTSGVLRGRCLPTYFWPSRRVAATVGMLSIFVNMILPIIVHCVCYISIPRVLRKRTTQVIPKENREQDTATTGQIVVTLQGTQSSNIDVLPSTPAAREVSNTKPAQATMTELRVPNALENHNESAKRNVTNTLTTVTAWYFLCWIPNKLYILMYMMGKITVFGNIYQATVVLVFINCCINPIIYITKFDAFKKGVAMLFGRHQIITCKFNCINNIY